MTPHAQAEADYCDSGACGGACTDQSVPPIPTFVDTFCCRAELPCVTHQAEAVVREYQLRCSHIQEDGKVQRFVAGIPIICLNCFATALQAQVRRDVAMASSETQNSNHTRGLTPEAAYELACREIALAIESAGGLG